MKPTTVMFGGHWIFNYFWHLLLEFQLFNMFYLFFESPKVMVPPQSSDLEHFLELREPLEYVIYVSVLEAVKLGWLVLIFGRCNNHIFVFVQQFKHVTDISKVGSLKKVHDWMGFQFTVEHSNLPFLDKHDTPRHQVQLQHGLRCILKMLLG